MVVSGMIAQVGPRKTELHVQVKELTLSTHVAPFMQGLESHSSIGVDEDVEVSVEVALEVNVEVIVDENEEVSVEVEVEVNVEVIVDEDEEVSVEVSVEVNVEVIVDEDEELKVEFKVVAIDFSQEEPLNPGSQVQE